MRWSKKQYDEYKQKNGDNTALSIANMEPDTRDASISKKGAARFSAPCSIHVHSVRKRLADSDGISAKAVIDGLVLAGILIDDSPRYVKEVSYSQEKANKKEFTIITIKEITV